MQVFKSEQDRKKAFLFVAASVIIFVSSYLLAKRYVGLVFDAGRIRLWTQGFGALAPVVFVLIQATQVVVATIPRQVLDLAPVIYSALWLGLCTVS